MKAILFSIGTRGDMEPFLAIAQILKERDWEVICVFPEQFREMVEEMGFKFEGFTREFLDMINSEETKKVMGGQGSVFSRFKILIRISKAGIRLSKSMIGLQHDVLQRENPDKVLYHPKCNYNLIWGMENPNKSIMVSPIPGTAHVVKHVTLFGNYGKPLNIFTAWLGNTVRAVVIKKSAKGFSINKKSKITISAIKKAMLKKEKTFYSISPSLFPRPKYWPQCAQVVGYYERDKTAHWQPDESLLSFIEANEKIVFISFGSMTNNTPKEKTQSIVNVLKKHKISAIINTSWGGLVELNDAPLHVHFVSNIPYDWIFPRVYAAVHHGGSGTTHTALKYGVPSLIIPHIIDQFFWNRTLAGLGLGPKGIPIKKLNEKDFEPLLLDLINNPSYKENAREISAKMKAESDPEKFYKMIVE